MLKFKGGYWFTLNPILDLQLGKHLRVMRLTYVNTRALNFRGGLGDKQFYNDFFESQGRFADYFNRYAESIRPAGGNIIPGIGIAKISRRFI
jgi:hypothetical protein